MARTSSVDFNRAVIFAAVIFSFFFSNALLAHEKKAGAITIWCHRIMILAPALAIRFFSAQVYFHDCRRYTYKPPSSYTCVWERGGSGGDTL